MSLATFITQAITKVSSDETYANMEFTTADEARVNFTQALLFELGLGPKPSAAHATATGSKEKAPKKKRAAKPSKEAVVAEAAVAVLEQVKEPPKEVEALAEKLGQLALDEQPKPKKARNAEEPAKKKPGPKPKTTSEGPVNLEKLTPTHKKHLKAIAEELHVETRDKEFLVYANELTAEVWGSKSLDDHIRAFLTPNAAELAPPPTEFVQVEFNGREYLVNPATKFVYASTGSDTVRARDHLGVVGVLEFTDMVV